jgi:hypothetical protein
MEDVSTSTDNVTRSTARFGRREPRGTKHWHQTGDRADDKRRAEPTSPGKGGKDNRPMLRRGLDARRDRAEDHASGATEEALYPPRV